MDGRTSTTSATEDEASPDIRSSASQSVQGREMPSDWDCQCYEPRSPPLLSHRQDTVYTRRGMKDEEEEEEEKKKYFLRLLFISASQMFLERNARPFPGSPQTILNHLHALVLLLLLTSSSSPWNNPPRIQIKDVHIVNRNKRWKTSPIFLISFL